MSNSVTQEKKQRAPSSIANQQQETIDKMTEIILSISSYKEVVVKANKVVAIAEQADPNSTMPGVQLLAGYMKIVPLLEGALFRIRPILEPSDWLHMSSLSALRTFQYHNYMYGKHIQALFDFMTIPSRAAGLEFKSVGELQNFIVSKALPALEELLLRAKKMESLPSENFEYKLNRTLFVGLNDNIRFLDKNETIKKYIKPFHYSLIFSLERALSTAYYWSAVNLDDLASITSEVLAATTINETRGKLRKFFKIDALAKGVTPQMYFKIVSKHPSYFAFKNISLEKGIVFMTAQELLNRSLNHATESSKYELAAFNCILDYTISNGSDLSVDECKNISNQDMTNQHAADGQDYLYNPNELLIDYRIKKAAIVQRYNLFEESKNNEYVQLTSEVTGKSLDLNIKALFNSKNSPRDMFPVKFEKEKQTQYDSKIGVPGWYYDHGFPIAFGEKNDYTLNGFFHPKQVYNLNTLKLAMTTLVYTKSISAFAVLLPFPTPVSLPFPSVDTFDVN